MIKMKIKNLKLVSINSSYIFDNIVCLTLLYNNVGGISYINWLKRPQNQGF